MIAVVFVSQPANEYWSRRRKVSLTLRFFALVQWSPGIIQKRSSIASLTNRVR